MDRFLCHTAMLNDLSDFIYNKLCAKNLKLSLTNMQTLWVFRESLRGLRHTKLKMGVYFYFDQMRMVYAWREEQIECVCHLHLLTSLSMLWSRQFLPTNDGYSFISSSCSSLWSMKKLKNKLSFKFETGASSRKRVTIS